VGFDDPSMLFAELDSRVNCCPPLPAIPLLMILTEGVAEDGGVFSDVGGFEIPVKGGGLSKGLVQEPFPRTRFPHKRQNGVRYILTRLVA
jgi:hypothetical protein